MQSSLTTTTERHFTTPSAVENAAPVSTEEILSLRQALQALVDHRHKHGVRYPFLEMLLIMVCAMFSGNTSLTSIAEWAADAHQRSPLLDTARTPSLSTFHRLTKHSIWTRRLSTGS